MFGNLLWINDGYCNRFNRHKYIIFWLWFYAGIYLLYLIKVVYIDNVNRNVRFSDEVDFNKPDKNDILIQQEEATDRQEGVKKNKNLNLKKNMIKLLIKLKRQLI